VLERLRLRVDERKAGMAVLVHPSVPDDEELANGVATSSHGEHGSHLSLVTQVGAESVTNPDGLAQPESVDVDAVWDARAGGGTQFSGRRRRLRGSD
jgi:hypothetical protein